MCRPCPVKKRPSLFTELTCGGRCEGISTLFLTLNLKRRRVSEWRQSDTLFDGGDDKHQEEEFQGREEAEKR